MQTFLPYASFIQTAKCLDYKRLGNQRLEASIIWQTLNGHKKQGWKNHPCVRQWRGYENALACYFNTIRAEWIRQGYTNNMPMLPIIGELVKPHWLGNKAYHRSHKSQLLSKNPPFYSQYKWNVPDDLPYVWPEGKELTGIDWIDAA